MVPRTKEQFSKIREKSYERILEAALELFTDVGFQDATIEKIAEKAGISKGLIYNYFTNKVEILNAVTDRSFSEIQSSDINLETISNPYKKLKAHIDATVDSLKENPKYYLLHFHLMCQSKTRPIIQGKLIQFLTTVNVMVKDIFRAMGKKDPAMEAMMFGAIIDGMVMRYTLSGGLYPIDLVKKRLIDDYCVPHGNMP